MVIKLKSPYNWGWNSPSFMTKLPCLRLQLHCFMLEVARSSPIFLTPLRPQWPFTARLPSSPSQEKFWKRSERGMRCQPPLLGSPGVLGEFLEGPDLELTHMSHKNQWKLIFLGATQIRFYQWKWIGLCCEKNWDWYCYSWDMSKQNEWFLEWAITTGSRQ